MKREMTSRSWKMTGLNLKLQKTEHSAEQRLTMVPFQASWGLHCTVSGGHFHLLPVQDSVSVSISFHSHGAAVYQVPFRNNERLPIPQSKVLHSSCGPPAFLVLSLPCYSPGFPTSHFPPVPEVTPIPRGPNPRPLLGGLI